MPKVDIDLSRQTQRFIGDIASNGIAGDCWRTAVASLLHIPRETVPHFVQLDEVMPNYDWFLETLMFVRKKEPGWTLVCLDYTSTVFPIYADPMNSPSRVILTGQSPRGEHRHAVLADAVTGDILWDPHPSRDGILDRQQVYVLEKMN